ncbi:hypothetical protein GCM10027514_45230 [Azotobacter armeniacus]
MPERARQGTAHDPVEQPPLGLQLAVAEQAVDPLDGQAELGRERPSAVRVRRRPCSRAATAAIRASRRRAWIVESALAKAACKNWTVCMGSGDIGQFGDNQRRPPMQASSSPT